MGDQGLVKFACVINMLPPMNEEFKIHTVITSTRCKIALSVLLKKACLRLQLKSKNFMSLTNEKCTIFVAGHGFWRAGVYSSYSSTCGIFTGVRTSTREASDVETTSKPCVTYGPTCKPQTQDVSKGFLILVSCIWILVLLLVILLAKGAIDSRFSEDRHMANNRFVYSEQRGFIDLVLCRHRFYPKVQSKTVLSQIMELLRQCGSDEDGCTGLPEIFLLQIFLQQHRGTNETVTVSRIQRLQCRHHHRYDEVRSAACQDCLAGVNEKHCIDANSNIINGACGFSCTVYFLSLHASGGYVVVRNVSICQCPPHSFQPCQLYEKHQDEMTDPKILQQEPGHLSQFYHGDNMQRYQINETFNDVFTFLYQELSTSYLDEIIDVKNEQFADSQCPFYAENLTHRKIYKSFKQCSTFCNRFNYTLIKQTGSDKEPEGLVSIVFHLGLLLFLVTFLISRRLSKGTSQMKQENAVFKANDDTISTCRLKKENHKQILIPQVYGTRPNQELGIIKKSIGDESFPSSSTLLPSYSVFNKSWSSSAAIHGLYSGNVSRIKETNMKELQTERIRSWLSSNPNLEELPFAKGF